MSGSAPRPDFKSSLLDPHRFTLTFELVPSRGGRGKEHQRTLDFARAAAADGRITAVSITENAGGHPALSPEVLGTEIQAMGLDVISHFSCKDKNRNQMESLLFAWDRIGLHNLLVITGDYPQEGFQGNPKPVFDLDSIQVLELLKCMNQGLPLFCDGNSPPSQIQSTTFFKGCALSPFKTTEAELLLQYAKLHRKVAHGADFVITQVGFDARKFHEVLLYLRQHELAVPVLGNLFIPNLPVLEHMYQQRVPGCVIPEKLYQLLKDQAAGSADRGKKARLLLAAKLLAALKGMGYAGAHIGGPGLSYDDVSFVLDQAAGFEPSWQDYLPELDFWPADTFCYFERDPASGLNRPQPAKRAGRSPQRLAYQVSHLFHNSVFAEQGFFYPPARALARAMGSGYASRALARVEHLIKFLAFSCQNCGDCTLAELGYLCPQSGCAKYLLNGPCGGSQNGWCEVFPGKKRCHYVRFYGRLSPDQRRRVLRDGYTPPRNWALNNTSSWLNYFQGRDHTSR